MVIRMGLEFLNGLTEQSMKEVSKTMLQMERANLPILMEIDMRDNGLIIRQRVLENIQELLVGIMKEAGKQMSLKDMEYKIGEMAIFIKVNLKMD
jgi:hypothetical protein